MQLELLSAPVRTFAERVLAAFPEWARFLEVPGRGDRQDDCSFLIDLPQYPGHKLHIVTRGDSVEVHYDDGQPPASAEALFVDLDTHPAGVAESVIAFVGDLFTGRTVVVREPVGSFWRWIRRHDCESLPRFRNHAEVAKSKRQRFVAIYSLGDEATGK